MNYTHYFSDLLFYERHANFILIHKINTVSKPGEDVIRIMSHIFNAQEIWSDRMQGIPTAADSWNPHKPSEFSDLLHRNIDRLKIVMEEIVADEWGKQFFYKNSNGDSFQSSYRDVYTHLMIHSSQHRGQVAWLLKPQTKSALDLDYIFYKRI